MYQSSVHGADGKRGENVLFFFSRHKKSNFNKSRSRADGVYKLDPQIIICYCCTWRSRYLTEVQLFDQVHYTGVGIARFFSATRVITRCSGKYDE